MGLKTALKAGEKIKPLGLKTGRRGCESGKGERAGVCMGRGKHFRWANAVLLGCVLRLCMPFCAGERGGGRFPTQGKTTAYGVK